MKGADYLVMRVDNGTLVHRRRTGATWKTGKPDWNFKPANGGITMVLSVGPKRVRLMRETPYRGQQVEVAVIARGTLAEVWETFMDYARMV